VTKRGRCTTVYPVSRLNLFIERCMLNEVHSVGKRYGTVHQCFVGRIKSNGLQELCTCTCSCISFDEF